VSVHLSVAAVEEIHQAVLEAHGGRPGIRERALLESAVAATQATAFGEPVFQDHIEIGAAYLFYLCRNHPFLDGNKRVGLAACLIYLEHNGCLPDDGLPAKDVDAWEALVLDVASSRLDRDQTTARLRALLGA
jgi:death-on-curing protein